MTTMTTTPVLVWSRAEAFLSFAMAENRNKDIRRLLGAFSDHCKKLLRSTPFKVMRDKGRKIQFISLTMPTNLLEHTSLLPCTRTVPGGDGTPAADNVLLRNRPGAENGRGCTGGCSSWLSSHTGYIWSAVRTRVLPFVGISAGGISAAGDGSVTAGSHRRRILLLHCSAG